jgi:hypothetical protein
MVNAGRKDLAHHARNAPGHHDSIPMEVVWMAASGQHPPPLVQPY